MSQCIIDAGITRDCGFSLGGLKELYLISANDVTGVTKTTGNTVTGLSLAAGSAGFLAFECEPNTAQLDQPLVVGAGGNVNQIINGTFAGINQTKKEVFKKVALSRLRGIARTKDDRYWYVGETQGLSATALQINTGAADSDAFVAVMTLEAGQNDYANEITEAAALAAIA